MYSRIAPGRLNRRRATAGTPPFNGNFGALVPGLLQYIRSDLGLTKTGPVINKVASQGGSLGTAGDIVEGSVTVGVANATVGLNGIPGFSNNGTTQYGVYQFTSPAPATTPLFRYTVFRSANTAARQYMDANSVLTVVSFREASATDVEMYGGAAIQANAPVGGNVWGRTYCLFTGSTSDTIKWGSNTPATGVNTGNTATGGAGRGIFAFENGTAISSTQEWLLHVQGAGVTPANLAAVVAALDAGVASLYGGLVSI